MVPLAVRRPRRRVPGGSRRAGLPLVVPARGRRRALGDRRPARRAGAVARARGDPRAVGRPGDRGAGGRPGRRGRSRVRGPGAPPSGHRRIDARGAAGRDVRRPPGGRVPREPRHRGGVPRGGGAAGRSPTPGGGPRRVRARGGGLAHPQFLLLCVAILLVAAALAWAQRPARGVPDRGDRRRRRRRARDRVAGRSAGSAALGGRHVEGRVPAACRPHVRAAERVPGPLRPPVDPLRAVGLGAARRDRLQGTQRQRRPDPALVVRPHLRRRRARARDRVAPRRSVPDVRVRDPDPGRVRARPPVAPARTASSARRRCHGRAHDHHARGLGDRVEPPGPVPLRGRRPGAPGRERGRLPARARDAARVPGERARRHGELPRDPRGQRHPGGRAAGSDPRRRRRGAVARRWNRDRRARRARTPHGS